MKGPPYPPYSIPFIPASSGPSAIQPSHLLQLEEPRDDSLQTVLGRHPNRAKISSGSWQSKSGGKRPAETQCSARDWSIANPVSIIPMGSKMCFFMYLPASPSKFSIIFIMDRFPGTQRHSAMLIPETSSTIRATSWLPAPPLQCDKMPLNAPWTNSNKQPEHRVEQPAVVEVLARNENVGLDAFVASALGIPLTRSDPSDIAHVGTCEL